MRTKLLYITATLLRSSFTSSCTGNMYVCSIRRQHATSANRISSASHYVRVLLPSLPRSLPPSLRLSCCVPTALATRLSNLASSRGGAGCFENTPEKKTGERKGKINFGEHSTAILYSTCAGSCMYITCSRGCLNRRGKGKKSRVFVCGNSAATPAFALCAHKIPGRKRRPGVSARSLARTRQKMASIIPRGMTERL